MIYSWSQFNYGHDVTSFNQTLVFSEGSGQKLYAFIEAGGYSLDEYAEAVEDALNQSGTLGYTVTVDRLNQNVLTISAPSAFTLYLSDAQFSASALLGFTSTSNLSGQSSYRADQTSGFIYTPQFKIQSYTPSNNFSESLEATVNQAASGRVELVRFGVVRKIEIEIKFISNLPMDNVVIKTNAQGVSDCLRFLDYATSKGRFEFVGDVTRPNTFETVILNSTPEYKDGTGYKLKELYADNVPDVYETGVMTLQVV